MLAPPARRTFTSSATASARQLKGFRSDGSVSHRVTGRYSVPLVGHKPGQPLPAIEDDPRLQRQKRPRPVRWRDLGEGEHPPGVFSPGRIPTDLPTSTSKVAQRIFLPNVRMILVRNAPPVPGTAMADQDPFIATFRCSPRLTKPDIMQYLRQCYGIGIRSIATTIYQGERVRHRHGGYRRKEASYKKVVVSLERPFLYPAPPSADVLENNFQIKQGLRDVARRKAIVGDLAVRGWGQRSTSDRSEDDGPPPRLPQLKAALAHRRAMAERTVRQRMAGQGDP